ncbi:MAG: hypothetical protein H0V95_11910 [Actinobacteria bacterium]|nr:hypothetical protein [Actinomycetota bacterium]
MKAVVIGVDRYRWVDDNGIVQEASRGDEIDVSQAEFDRVTWENEDGETVRALEKPGSKAAKEATVEPNASDGETPDETS